MTTDTTLSTSHAAPPAPARPEVVDVGRAAAAVRRNWRRIALGVAIGVALSLMYLRLAPPRYEATATVRIDARQSTLPSIYTEETARDEVFTEIEVLRSRTIATDVVRELSLQAELVEPRRTSRDAVFRSIRVTNPADTGTYHLIRQRDGRYRVEETGALVTRGQAATVGGTTLVLEPADRDLEVVKLHVQSEDAAITRLLKEVNIGRAGLQAVVLLILWLLGVVTSYTMGGFIHLLLVVAVVILVVRLVTGRRVI